MAVRSLQEETFEQPVALSTDNCTVEGLTLVKNFVSEEEEQVPTLQSQQTC